MKKIALIFLCLLLLTACGNTDDAVITGQISESPPPVSAEQSVNPAPSPSLHDGFPATESKADELPPPHQTQTVSITVYALDNEILFSADAEIYEGMTALDILLDCAKEQNIPVVYSGSKSAAYVTSIGGLAEKQHGGTSGWIYTLNGESVMIPCGKCTLSPGDKVEWKYITEF